MFFPSTVSFLAVRHDDAERAALALGDPDLHAAAKARDPKGHRALRRIRLAEFPAGSRRTDVGGTVGQTDN
jgi:hypothetical protein